MKILLGYYHYPYAVDVGETIRRWAASIADELAITIDCIALNIDPPSNRLHWPELDKRWRRGHRGLLNHYQEIGDRCADYDVFLNYNGIDMHPRFIETLPCLTAYGCFDDPESSADLSEPVASSYDVCLVGNIAELDRYRAWGCERVHFWPIGFHADEHNPNLTVEDILQHDRHTDITLLCERVTGFRGERLDKWVAAFPNGRYHGPGWDSGFLPEEEKVPLYQQTRIGPNFHNSTGPINYRTFTLPANGIALMCDNKSHLGGIFEPGVEAIGFDTIEEAIELTHYYLQHEDERRSIAAAGFQRSIRDYNEIAVFKRAVDIFATLLQRPKTDKPHWKQALRRHYRRTALTQTAVRIIRCLKGAR